MAVKDRLWIAVEVIMHGLCGGGWLSTAVFGTRMPVSHTAQKLGAAPSTLSFHGGHQPRASGCGVAGREWF